MPGGRNSVGAGGEPSVTLIVYHRPLHNAVFSTGLPFNRWRGNRRRVGQFRRRRFLDRSDDHRLDGLRITRGGNRAFSFRPVFDVLPRRAPRLVPKTVSHPGYIHVVPPGVRVKTTKGGRVG
jgi:hypothetical protein